jgi:hypothetical protein
VRRTALLSALAVTLAVPAVAPAVAAAVPLTVGTTVSGRDVSITQPQPLPVPTCSFAQCVYDLAPGTRVTVTVPPNSRFSRWAGPCERVPDRTVCTFSLNRPTLVRALFLKAGQSAPECNGDACTSEGGLSDGAKLLVVVDGRGAVNISATLASGKKYKKQCFGVCRLTVRQNGSVFLQAVAGYPFVGFTGAYPSLQSAHQFRVKQNATVNARFVP